METRQTKRVMAAGHICLDITPVFAQNTQAELGQILLPGKLVQVGQPDIHLGGSVANTGLALHYFGADVCLAAKVGADDFGQIVRRQLDHCGCQTRLMQDEAAGTSYSVVIAAPGVDRIFLHDPGANDTFCADDISDALLDDIDHFHFGYPPLMARMYEDEGRQMEALFRRAKNMGITTSMDMAAVDPSSPAGQVDWVGILSRVLPYIDFFVPSVEEICFMLDRAQYDCWNSRADGGDVTEILSIEEDVAPLAARLLKMGAAAVLLKCGGRGIYYRTSESERMLALCRICDLNAADWYNIEGFETSFLPEKVVCATGAGDTCIAAFLTAMLTSRSMEDCVRLAAAAGACCVSTYDSLSGLMLLPQLEARIRSGWPKIEG